MTHVALLRKTKSYACGVCNFHFFAFLLNCLFIDSIQFKTIIGFLKEITDLSIVKTDSFRYLLKLRKIIFRENMFFETFTFWMIRILD